MVVIYLEQVAVVVVALLPQEIYQYFLKVTEKNYKLMPTSDSKGYRTVHPE
jgi:hypothetical protein